MIFDIITIFPDYYNTPLKYGVIGKAIENKILKVNIHNLRDYSNGKHRQIDDRPFGGGSGMVFMIEPIYNALNFIRKSDSKVILLSPTGKKFNQKTAKELSAYENLIFISPRYEGVDERVKEFVDMEISIGDYIITGGDAAVLVLIEAISRHIKGVVGKEESVINESFETELLDYPQYTQPRDFMGMKVPEVLLSGNHKLIDEWRKKRSIEITKKKRPDLIKNSEKIK
jgi:tRNA (guanine37-N1)-methyltransferase